MQELKDALRSASKNLFDADIEPELTQPDEQFGDYSTNLALQLGSKLNKNPRQLAVALAAKLHGHPGLDEVKIAGPGFIKITLSDQALRQAANQAVQVHKTLKGQEVLVEFGDPNPFKEMHIGHLYSYIVGDTISRLLEASGATVRRLSYHGDVGLHVAKAIWGMRSSRVEPNETAKDLVAAIGSYYQKGAEAYENDEPAKAEIEKINQHIYKKDDEVVNGLYEWGKDQSFKEFDAVLADLDIKVDKRYLESEAADAGLLMVHRNKGKVFKQSQGAIVYEGEKEGLHTRVFITSKGLPTYETKDLGLSKLKAGDYPKAAKSLIITAHEQSDYFKVMLAALKQIDEKLAAKTTHLYHGFVTLSTGKMSSRKGEVYTAAMLMSDVHQQAKKLYENQDSRIETGAIKYGFLKHRLGSDIVYDVGESISLEGSSGPYLQYAYARAKSILNKKSSSHQKPASNSKLDKAERSLARKISQYPEVVQEAAAEFLPSHVATYLYELAQAFNSFYEKSRVIGDAREVIRLELVKAYTDVLKHGLELLNINAPEKV